MTEKRGRKIRERAQPECDEDKFYERKTYERKTKTPEQALSALMRLASRGEKSSGDALRLMQMWGVDPESRAGILKALIDQRFIDDRRYAQAYVREKSKLNGWGAYKIGQMLAAKGIDRKTADEALSQIAGNVSSGRLREMLERKLRTLKDEDPYKLKAKLIRYGLSLGYGYDEVCEEVENIMRQHRE